MNRMTVETNLIPAEFAELAAAAKERLQAAPGCHDWEHSLRVLRNALRLAENTDANREIIILAAILHDIARPDEMVSRGGVCHAAIGAEYAEEILRKQGWKDEDAIAAIVHCVRSHRFRGDGPRPATTEAAIVHDADKLDSLGAIGIGRAFHFAGRFGAKVDNTEEEAINSDAYSDNDTALREYLVKLRHLPDRMLTEAGKNEAHERAEFMRGFFARLNREVRGGKQ